MKKERLPKILIPYKPAEGFDERHRDFFIILRPETNGVEVESLLLKVVAENPLYKKNVSFVYLANIPGDFIIGRRIVEQHYHLKISFSRMGRRIFTPYMQKIFSDYFDVSFKDAEILGSFQSLKHLGLTEDELFRIRVDSPDMLDINGQNIKKINGVFVVNYDIPAILHKNSHETDIAVMVFRTGLEEPEFRKMIKSMADRLMEKGILAPKLPISRVFHYSKSPLEFLLDSSGYLLKNPMSRYPLGELEFIRFLNSRGISLRIIEGALKYPLFTFLNGSGGLVERDIFQYTLGSSFETSYQKLASALGQCYIA